MATFERKTYIVSLVALIVAIICAVLAYAAIDASWRIASLSGNFDKIDYKVGISEFPLVTSGSTRIFIGSQHASDDNSLVVGAIPFTVVAGAKKMLTT